MKLKKQFTILCATALAVTSIYAGGIDNFTKKIFADGEETIDVYVTITTKGEICYDKDNNPVIIKDVKVSDTNENGKYDIDDVLKCTHDAAGFPDGYKSENTQWGLGLKKLWGVENGGCYGYYVNNKMAFSLSDVVDNGDYISAYAYKDTSSYTDTYAYFDKTNVELKYDEPTMEITLNKITFDSAGNTIVSPVSDAVVTTLEDNTITGTPDENGNVSITLNPGKTYTIVSTSTTTNYVPAYCKVTVEAVPEETEQETEQGTEQETEIETEIETESQTEPVETPTETETKSQNDTNVDTNNDTVDGPEAGKTVKDKKYTYKVTKAGSTDGKVLGELQVTGLKKKGLTTIKIATTVKIDNVNYKVTSVGEKAFKGNKKIKKVFVGKNVVSIEANAFAKCKKLKQASINSPVLESIKSNAFAGDKKLKKIIIKSTNLTSVGKNALKKTNKKLVVKVPKSNKKAYKKLFKKAGNKKLKVK